ncbi:hypothetical protein TRFO_42784 [Tritrichomonas foetus]|uniref:Uncharacterized protein n=1 Tax=Tritrichomonas foetus TaxID=1144522 RepID=A0A1J4KUP8_9EUKA|nr:hypothetical protein TRFO_42784 [Tritrichomonas foetus]|eukprot:OHT14995.1 hypothetical protein TRFO_42784 [Tritrichomonas foetus]
MEEILRQQKIAEFKKKIEAKREEFQQLRNANSIDDALKALNHLGNCLNDIEPSQAEKFFFNHPHVGNFAKKSENDEQGEKFEGGVAANVLFIVCNTYTKPKYQLCVGPLNDSVTVAVNHKKMGYKVVYLHFKK